MRRCRPSYNDGPTAFELSVTGGRSITVDAWRERARSLGLEAEFHPGFVMESHSGLVQVRFRVTSPALFPGGKRWGASGTRVGAFEFEIERFEPGAGAEVASKLDERIEEFAARGAPAVILDRWREKRLHLEQPDEGDEQRVHFRTGTGRSFADYLAEVVLAAAYALACDGTLEDPQDWGKSWPPDPGQLGFGHTRRGEKGITDALTRQLRYGPLPGAVQEIHGPPRLVLGSALAARPWNFSGPHGEVILDVGNHGGAASGLRIMCSSDLIARGAIQVDEATVSEGGWELARARYDEARGFVFSDLRFPPGIDPAKPALEVAFTCAIGFDVRGSGAALLRFKLVALAPEGEALVLGRMATIG